MNERLLILAFNVWQILLSMRQKGMTLTGQAVFEGANSDGGTTRVVVTNNNGTYEFSPVYDGPSDLPPLKVRDDK